MTPVECFPSVCSKLSMVSDVSLNKIIIFWFLHYSLYISVNVISNSIY